MSSTPGAITADGRRRPGGSGADDAIARHGDGPLLVTGAPGSGRTAALATRFAALLDAGVRPERVLCLVGSGSTEPLRRRLDAVVGGRAHDELVVRTLPGAAAALLRDEAGAAGLDPFTVVATRSDRLALLLGRIDELPLRHHDLGGRPALLIGTLLARIDALKAAGVTASDLGAWASRLPDGESRTLREREFAQIAATHDRMLQQAGLLDTGEVVLTAQRVLERNDHVRARVAARWRHLLVDDLEDVTPAQLRLIELLCAPVGDLVATVDPGGRMTTGGLSPARIAALVAHGIGGHRTSTIDLGPSRRCPPQVARVAAIDPQPTDDAEPCVHALRATTVRAEAQAVAARIAELIADGAAPEEIAVLVPSVRRDGQAPALALSERSIPHRLAGAAALLGQAEVRDVVAWLRLLSDPSDATAAVRALTRPPIALHGVDVARCLQVARRRRLDMVRGLTAATESPQLPPEARDRVLAFLRHYERAAEALDTTRPDRFVHELIDDLGLRRRQVFTAQADVIERLRGLARLCELAAGYGDRAPQATPRDFARWLASLADAGVPEGEDEQAETTRGVTILELGAAKGHAWDHVLLCGLSSAQLPGRGGQHPIPLPAELLGEPDARIGAHEREAEHARALLRLGASRAVRTLTLSFATEGPGGATRTLAPAVAAACERAGVGWVAVGERLGSSADETLQSAFAELRDELLADVQRIGARLGELRLDTDLDVAHGATRYLELLKVAAVLARPEGQPVAEALPAITSAIERAATSLQREILQTSSLDALIVGAGTGTPRRTLDAAATARHEPSLEPFLPRRGPGLALSASDLDTYRTCPLKYKFARVLRVPQDPTINQRFGIVVHQVLERFHAADPGSPARPRALQSLLGLLDASWRRAGFGWATDEEVQLWRKAEDALRRYHERFHAEDVEPTWFERSFTFRLGAHTLRGRVDRVDRLPDGGYELIDYKTGRPRTAEDLREDVQLALYAVAARRAWDLPASSQAYLYVLDDLKVPLPEGAADEGWIGEIVGEVAAGITAQNFEPTPSFAACSICDHQLACPAAEH